MFCTNCGAELPDGAKFCASCGTPTSSPAVGQADATTRIDERTAVMPAPSPVVDTVRRNAPLSADETVMAPEPAVSPSSRRARHTSSGSRTVAIVMTVIAAVAVIALVVVVVDPFQLGSSSQSQEEIAAEDASSDEDAASMDAEDDAAATDDSTSDDSETSDGTTSTDSSDETTRVTIIGGDDDSSEGASTDAYNPSGSYILPYSDTYQYSASDLSGFSDWELYIARNEIYARHGREFNNEGLQAYFNGQSWYTPLYTPDEFDAMASSLLNSVEQANVATIRSVEQERGSSNL